MCKAIELSLADVTCHCRNFKLDPDFLLACLVDIARKCLPSGMEHAFAGTSLGVLRTDNDPLPYRQFAYKERLVEPGLYHLYYTFESWYIIP